MNFTNEQIQTFISNNRSTESYGYAVKMDESDYFDPKATIDISRQSKYVIDNAIKDMALFAASSEAYYKRKGLKIGSIIELPDGSETRITHVWDDGQVQTGGPGSCHLTKGGYISRSGGLDSGLKKECLVPTDRLGTLSVWFWHGGMSGGGRGVYSTINVPIFTTKKGSDLSGIPQIAENIRQKIIAKSETITRINGNGQEYSRHMPEIVIIKPHESYKAKIIPGKSFVIGGISFLVRWDKILVAQPMTRASIDKLLSIYEFAGTYYDNASHQNTLCLYAMGGKHKVRYPKLR